MSATRIQTKPEAISKKQETEAPCTPERESTLRAEPRREHRWLHKLVGEWTYEGDATMEPGQPAVKFMGPRACGRSAASGRWPKDGANCPAADPRRRS